MHIITANSDITDKTTNVIQTISWSIYTWKKLFLSINVVKLINKNKLGNHLFMKWLKLVNTEYNLKLTSENNRLYFIYN